MSKPHPIVFPSTTTPVNSNNGASGGIVHLFPDEQTDLFTEAHIEHQIDVACQDAYSRGYIDGTQNANTVEIKSTDVAQLIEFAGHVNNLMSALAASPMLGMMLKGNPAASAALNALKGQ